MYRRRLLASATVFLAGCSTTTPLPPATESPTPARTATETSTTSPTPTPTPDPLPFDISVDAPDVIAVGDGFDITVNVTNISAQQRRFRREIRKRWVDESGWTVAHVVDLRIEAGETKQIAIPFATQSRVGTQQYRLTGTDVSWTIEITTSEER